MGASFVPITVFTVLWGIVGIVCPFFAPKGPNRGVIQVVLILTAATCWLFWLCAYMAQMNPLIGPKLTNETLIWMSRTWTYPKNHSWLLGYIHCPNSLRDASEKEGNKITS